MNNEVSQQNRIKTKTGLRLEDGKVVIRWKNLREVVLNGSVQEIFDWTGWGSVRRGEISQQILVIKAFGIIWLKIGKNSMIINYFEIFRNINAKIQTEILEQLAGPIRLRWVGWANRMVRFWIFRRGGVAWFGC